MSNPSPPEGKRRMGMRRGESRVGQEIMIHPKMKRKKEMRIENC